MLTATLEWMWDTIAEPVLDKLGFTTGPDEEAWPRVWWCPTGPLTLLPLHAAGYHRETSSAAPRTVLDRVISSYTPTVRALAEARRPPGAEDEEQAQERILVVGVPNALDQIPLEAIDGERAAIEQALPGRHTVLWDENATVDAVLQDLPRHRWAHFSCHGDQDLTDPSQGGLLLHDGKLTITDVAQRRFHGDFVGLSACKTAVGGVELLDEAITLAAALFYTGYRHVVASLWSIAQDVAAEVFAELYARICQGGGLDPEQAAVELHHIVRRLRSTQVDRPTLWTPFTHTGP